MKWISCDADQSSRSGDTWRDEVLSRPKPFRIAIGIGQCYCRGFFGCFFWQLISTGVGAFWVFLDFGLSFFGSGLSFEFFSPKLLEFFFSLRFSENICKIMHICYYLLKFFGAPRPDFCTIFKIQTCLKTSFGGTSVKNDKIVVLKKISAN